MAAKNEGSSQLTYGGRYDPFGDVQRGQDLAKIGVEGYGETLKRPLMREIGSALGGLNSIGALRSGGANVALSDIADKYANTIGSYAKMAEGAALDTGLQAAGMREGHDQYQQQRSDQQKASLWGSIGSVLGAGIGFFAGGPAGALAGSKLGGGAGKVVNQYASEGA